VRAQQVASPGVPPQAHVDESELPQAHSLPLPVQQALRPVTPLPAQEPPAPCALLELRALRARSALPLERLEPLARSVLLRLAQRSLAAPPRVQQASAAPPSLLLPSPLFLLWQPLPLALLLRRRPDSFCAPFPQRPRGSSSSASSFP
jgi:hypothetical protein